MGKIAENISLFREMLAGEVSLVAVSKTMPVEAIQEAYAAGQRIFGENRVNELLVKQPLLPGDIEWHMIGHLQRNKVKFIAPFISMIQSADSKRLIETINNEADRAARKIKCLLQFHIALEETKYGLDMEEASVIAADWVEGKLSGIEICGVMGMATYTDDNERIRGEFRFLKQCFDQLKRLYFRDNDHFSMISMGMSGDYRVAIEEGSNVIRVGSSIFGER
ncbi:MAG: YggS family pyridoxal phosphate-dependent enzyme [Bacteroidia bacterium]|nr:MAG: YggS family pyridoxal phosphate-dependent enzyme [Bacteroidia bacterium]